MNTSTTTESAAPAPAPESGKISPMRFLADAATSPALYNRVPPGSLMNFVGTAGWKSSGRRQYALGAAAIVEQYRLMKRIVRDSTFGDQAVPWGTMDNAPARVKRAARKLQYLATLEQAESAITPFADKPFAETLRKLVPGTVSKALKALRSK